MSERKKDELIEAQNEVIGILFEVVKRLQKNNDLDEEYFQIISNKKSESKNPRLQKILLERKKNSKIVGRLLEKLEV